MMFLQESFTTSTALNLSFKAWFEHSQPSSQVIAQTLILITQSPNSQLFQPQELKSQLQKLQSLPQSLQTFHSFFLKAHQILIKTQSTPFFTHSSLPFSTLRSHFQIFPDSTPKLKSSFSEATIGQGKEMIQKFKLMLVLLLKIKKSQGRGWNARVSGERRRKKRERKKRLEENKSGSFPYIHRRVGKIMKFPKCP